ncbi:hypothetical protein BO79DRAFT_235463 [Aspergillus costaricaensis CBS 115574]|uniref:Uncharacterized protein n=1 Tax=Aspergillus costaricaensis CBS 115574 TaxID=1448317 RepID=A0ACD1IQ04_9EURO|nr:hypothetical protein BO79DRAFT_235463 [Aspergillus costaricaensis CBS 115574]RAK92135.1 hypothetical protein BO79DRAFT_235463 [Aspergillus costaricaensis CBS 115574]
MIGAPCILTLLLAGRIAARRQRLDSGHAVSKGNPHALYKVCKAATESREKIRPWTDYSAPPIRTAVDVDLTSSSVSFCRRAASSSIKEGCGSPRTPERLQAPAPLSRSHSVSPKRTSLNRKDREKTDTGNIGISARSCDSADCQKAGPKRETSEPEREDGRISSAFVDRPRILTIRPGELTPEAVKPALQSGHPRTHANWGEMKLAASLAWWDPLICQPVEGEHNTVQATRTREGGGVHKTPRDYSEGEEGGGDRKSITSPIAGERIRYVIRAIPAWYRSPARSPGQAHGNHFTGRVGFPQKIDLGLGQWKVWMTSRNELEKFDRVEPTGILGNARCVSGQWRAPKSAGQGYGKATRQ